MAGSVNKYIVNLRAADVTPQAMALYADGLSLPQISERLDVPPSTIRLHMLKAGCQLRTRAEGIQTRFATREASPLKGIPRGPMSESTKDALRVAAIKRGEESAVGLSLKPNGYLEHTRGPHKGRGAHVVIVEDRIGRRLRPDEVVHHINENKTDNRSENLALMTRSEHARLHRTGKVEEKWAEA